MNGQDIFATFECSVVDEPEFSESDDVLVAGGCKISVMLIAILRDMGYSVDGPYERSFYGWEFIASGHGQKYFFVLQLIEEWLLIAEDVTGFIGKLRKNRPSLRDMLDKLSLRLISDGRFHNILWFSREEYSSGNTIGRSSP